MQQIERPIPIFKPIRHPLHTINFARNLTSGNKGNLIFPNPRIKEDRTQNYVSVHSEPQDSSTLHAQPPHEEGGGVYRVKDTM